MSPSYQSIEQLVKRGERKPLPPPRLPLERGRNVHNIDRLVRTTRAGEVALAAELRRGRGFGAVSNLGGRVVRSRQEEERRERARGQTRDRVRSARRGPEHGVRSVAGGAHHIRIVR